jgi:predicted histidine transporter YuiF (NhaC family)
VAIILKFVVQLYFYSMEFGAMACFLLFSARLIHWHESEGQHNPMMDTEIPTFFTLLLLAAGWVAVWCFNKSTPKVIYELST